MKAVILAGGHGTRISEETHLKPKPMIEIGGKPILWHIMKTYSTYGVNDFVICCGYKSHVLKQFFLKYLLGEYDHDMINKNPIKIQAKISESWNVTLVDTGLETMTGGRLKKIKEFVDNDTFCFTYGDTLNDVNIRELIKFHKKNKTLGTVTACIPPEKYGILYLKDDKVTSFKEKPNNEKDWVNGGFFVLEPEVFSLITDDSTVWEKEPMEKLVDSGQLSAFRHTGFYQPMDTLSDKKKLEELWNTNPHWKKWSS
jgi:glucose-1-phosphate cytidylyltransferase